MTDILDRVKSSKRAMPRRTVIYGPPGCGKSTWAASWPDPIVIDIEDGLADIDVPAMPCEDIMTAWEACVRLGGGGHKYKTVVFDSLDWLERLIHRGICEKHDVKNLSDFSYGKGHVYAAESFLKFMRNFNVMRSIGVHVVLVCHSHVVRIEKPGLDSYQQIQPRLHKLILDPLYEWADEILYATPKVYTRTSNEGFGRERTIASGGEERVIYTSYREEYIAKNRIGLPDEIPMTLLDDGRADFSVYGQYLPDHTTTKKGKANG